MRIGYECRQRKVTDAQGDVGVLCVAAVTARGFLCFGYYSAFEGCRSDCCGGDALSIIDAFEE